MAILAADPPGNIGEDVHASAVESFELQQKAGAKALPRSGETTVRSKIRVRKIQSDLMDRMGLWQLLKEDFRAHNREITRPGFQAMAVYRFGVWARTRKHYSFRVLFSFLHFLPFCFVRNFYGIELRSTARLGRRVRIGHQSGIVIHNYCTIGDDCTIRQNVTIGIGGMSRSHFGPEDGPVIGNNVDFGVGAVVIGNVKIGDNVNIGPNAVVLSDVKSNMTVMSAPSRSIPRPEGPKPDASLKPSGSDSA